MLQRRLPPDHVRQPLPLGCKVICQPPHELAVFIPLRRVVPAGGAGKLSGHSQGGPAAAAAAALHTPCRLLVGKACTGAGTTVRPGCYADERALPAAAPGQSIFCAHQSPTLVTSTSLRLALSRARFGR